MIEENRQGTIVLCQNIFGSLPVRQKSLNRMGEMMKIKAFVQNMSVLHHPVEFSVCSTETGRNSSDGLILFLVPLRSVAARISYLHSAALLAKMTSYQFTWAEYTLSGLISPPNPCSCHGNKECQYLFINRRWTRYSCSLTRTLCELYGRILVGSSGNTGGPVPMHQFSPGQQQQRAVHPCFVLQLTCPASCVDVLLEKDKSLIKFADDLSVLKCLHGFLLELFEAYSPAIMEEFHSFWAARLGGNSFRDQENYDWLNDNLLPGLSYQYALSRGGDPVSQMITHVSSKLVEKPSFDGASLSQSAGRSSYNTSSQLTQADFDDAFELNIPTKKAEEVVESDNGTDTMNQDADNSFGLHRFAMAGSTRPRTGLIMPDPTSTRPVKSQRIERNKSGAGRVVLCPDKVSLNVNEELFGVDMSLLPQLGVAVSRNFSRVDYFDALLADVPTTTTTVGCEDIAMSSVGLNKRSSDEENHHRADGFRQEAHSVSCDFKDETQSSWADLVIDHSVGDFAAVETVDGSIDAFVLVNSYVSPKKIASTHQPLTVSRADFASMMCVGQVDDKFIAALNPETQQIFLFDQHAADERVKLEAMYSKHCGCNSICVRCFNADDSNDSVNIQLLVPHVAVDVTDVDLLTVRQYADILKAWKFGFSEEGVDTNAELGAQLTVNSRRIQLHSVPVVVGEPLSSEDFVEYIHWLQANTASPRSLNKPPAVHRILCSKACKRAVKFGDSLTISDSNKIICDLQRAAYPFQCAHGRPNCCPLPDVSDWLQRRREQQLDRRMLFSSY
jgi:DNA mismatch repair ATPase MutL